MYAPVHVTTYKTVCVSVRYLANASFLSCNPRKVVLDHTQCRLQLAMAGHVAWTTAPTHNTNCTARNDNKVVPEGSFYNETSCPWWMTCWKEADTHTGDPPVIWLRQGWSLGSFEVANATTPAVCYIIIIEIVLDTVWLYDGLKQRSQKCTRLTVAVSVRVRVSHCESEHNCHCSE